jgi:hypothetical protein
MPAGLGDLPMNTFALVWRETARALGHAGRTFEFQHGVGQLKAAPVLNPPS